MPDTGVAVLSARSGNSQLWQLPLDGGETRQVSAIVDIGTFRMRRTDAASRDAGSLPECGELACSRKRFDDKPVDVRQALRAAVVRHWGPLGVVAYSHMFSAPWTPRVDSGSTRPDAWRFARTYRRDRSAVTRSTRFRGGGSCCVDATGRRTGAWSTISTSTPRHERATPPRPDHREPGRGISRQFLDGRHASVACNVARRIEADRYRISFAAPWPDTGTRARLGSLAVVARVERRHDARSLSRRMTGATALFATAWPNGQVRRLTNAGQVIEFSPAKAGAVIALADLNACRNTVCRAGCRTGDS